MGSPAACWTGHTGKAATCLPLTYTECQTPAVFVQESYGPADIKARAHCRAVCGEMHSGFSNLRSALGVISGTMVQDFDVLALGMSPGVDFDSGRFIGQIFADFGRTRFNQITTDADSITRYLYSISTYNGELWVDESHGMSPIRFTFQHRELKEKNFKSCQVDWKEIEGVWVPASCSMEETRSGVTQTYHLTLDWQLVNKPLDPEFFTAAGLVRDENVFVIDSRLGKPVIEPAIAILDPIAIAMATPKTVPSNPSHRLLWFILGNIALFGFVFWLFRRRRKRGTQ